jgi:1-acyl-sn-glycerol-3-phosphate acyltransferase
MTMLDSVRVLAAMARITAPSLVDLARGELPRHAIDERARWFGKRVVELLAVDLHVTGVANVPTGRAYVYMSNHQSHLDIPILYATLPSPTIRMLAKKELFQIPIWGRALRAAEFVEVDRANHSRAVQSIELAAELIRDGVSIWIAPEGTRSRDGSIGPLKKGGFHLASETQTPIVPVAIRGTLAILPRGARAMRTGERVDVAIGAPIAVAGSSLDDLAHEVGEFLAAHAGA